MEIGSNLYNNIDRNQNHHAILRNYPVLGRVRYFLEKVSPEFW
ncbi:hypothetical protein [Peribacillus frigoritolerans]